MNETSFVLAVALLLVTLVEGSAQAQSLESPPPTSCDTVDASYLDISAGMDAFRRLLNLHDDLFASELVDACFVDECDRTRILIANDMVNAFDYLGPEEVLHTAMSIEQYLEHRYSSFGRHMEYGVNTTPTGCVDVPSRDRLSDSCGWWVDVQYSTWGVLTVAIPTDSSQSDSFVRFSPYHDDRIECTVWNTESLDKDALQSSATWDCYSLELCEWVTLTRDALWEGSSSGN